MGGSYLKKAIFSLRKPIQFPTWIPYCQNLFFIMSTLNRVLFLGMWMGFESSKTTWQVYTVLCAHAHVCVHLHFSCQWLHSFHYIFKRPIYPTLNVYTSKSSQLHFVSLSLHQSPVLYMFSPAFACATWKHFISCHTHYFFHSSWAFSDTTSTHVASRPLSHCWLVGAKSQ